MKNKNYQSGFVGLAIVVIVALGVAIGGGVYYSKNKASKEMKVETDSSASENSSGKSNSVLAGKNKGALRALLALGGNQKCTVNGTANGNVSSGTVYISDSSMRGDFVSTVNGGSSVESHMIKNGDDVFVWSGSNGAKMKVSAMESASASSQNQTSVSLDQSVDYECESWAKDQSKFTIPNNINFIDISAMMQRGVQGQMNLPADLKVGY